MRALSCAALVAIWGHCALAFFPGYFPPSNVREASQNYYGMYTSVYIFHFHFFKFFLVVFQSACILRIKTKIVLENILMVLRV